MVGQFELGIKHTECVNIAKKLIAEIEELSVTEEKNPKERIKEYLSRNFGVLPSESNSYNDYLGLVVATEEISKKDSLSAYILSDQVVFREIMKAYGTSKPDKILEKGETISLLCLEPGYSSFREMQTTAVKTSDGWQLNGIKLISSEQIYSDKYLIFARDSENNNIRLFTVYEEDIRIKEVKKSVSSSDFALNQVHISLNIKDENMVGVINDGFEKIQIIARTLIAAIAVGIGHSSLIKSIEMAKETKNAAGEALSTSQNIQFALADMFSEIEAARMLTYYSADSIDKNNASIKIASMAKVKASDAAADSTLETLHLLGNIGFIANTDMSLIQRAVDTRIKGGTNRVQKAGIYEYMLAKK